MYIHVHLLCSCLRFSSHSKQELAVYIEKVEGSLPFPRAFPCKRIPLAKGSISLAKGNPLKKDTAHYLEKGHCSLP